MSLRPPLSLSLVSAMFVSALPSSSARANDSAMGGTAADLSPERSTQVRMVSEDIVLEHPGREPAWRVSAHYVFENTTDAEVRLQMGFPEHRCDPEGESDCVSSGAFRGLRTKVRGVEVPQRVGRVSPRSPWHTELGDVYLYDVTFAPRERLEVDHTYEVDGYVSVMGYGIQYLTVTGRNWRGPIGRARFTVRLAETPWGLEGPAGFPRIASRRVPVGDGAGYEMVFERTRWVPRTNFSVSIFDRHAALEFAGCPGAYGDYEASLAHIDDAVLRRCRNLVFARHGRAIADRALRRLFFEQGLPIYDQNRMLPYVVAPDFDASWLTLEDHRYVAFLAQEERRRALARREAARP